MSEICEEKLETIVEEIEALDEMVKKVLVAEE